MNFGIKLTKNDNFEPETPFCIFNFAVQARP